MTATRSAFGVFLRSALGVRGSEIPIEQMYCFFDVRIYFTIGGYVHNFEGPTEEDEYLLTREGETDVYKFYLDVPTETEFRERSITLTRSGSTWTAVVYSRTDRWTEVTYNSGNPLWGRSTWTLSGSTPFSDFTKVSDERSSGQGVRFTVQMTELRMIQV